MSKFAMLKCWDCCQTKMEGLFRDFGPIDPATNTFKYVRCIACQRFKTVDSPDYNGAHYKLLTILDEVYWLQRDSQLNQPLLAAIRRLRSAPDAGPFYIATNQEHLRALHLWSTLGLQHIFDDIFYAARLGAMKPGRAFFEAAAARMGPQDEPPLMFDDSPEVIAAARAFGWDAVAYDSLDDFTGQPWVAQRLPRS